MPGLSSAHEDRQHRTAHMPLNSLFPSNKGTGGDHILWLVIITDFWEAFEKGLSIMGH